MMHVLADHGQTYFYHCDAGAVVAAPVIDIVNIGVSFICRATASKGVFQQLLMGVMRHKWK